MKYPILYLIFLLSFLLISCGNPYPSQESEVTTTVGTDTPLFVVIGKPFMPTERQILAKKYGFKFWYVGCDMSPENEKLKKEHNPQTDKMLRQKFGDTFWNKFDRELDSLAKVGQ